MIGLAVRLLTRLSSPRAAVLLAALVPVGFLAAGLVRAAPFVDDVTPELSRGDDWLTYKRYAVSIVEGGLSMPAVAGPYRRPGGFLDNYFLAGVFWAFGTNASYAYVAQSALLGLSIALMFLAFRRYLRPETGLVLLACLGSFMTVDMFRRYAFRLLSENLLIALLPAMFWLVLRSHDRRGLAGGAAAGLLAGSAFLARPNLLLLGPAVAVLFLAYARPGVPRRLALPVVFTSAFLLTAALMPVRNFVASGRGDLTALTYTRDWAAGSRSVRAPTRSLSDDNLRTAANYYGRRVLFTVGILPAFVPQYRVRPHWLVAWAGVFAFAWIAVRRRTLEFWQALLVAFLVVYLGPLLAVAMIHNYGFRMIVPAVPAVVVLAVYAGEQVVAGMSRASPVPAPRAGEP